MFRGDNHVKSRRLRRSPRRLAKSRVVLLAAASLALVVKPVWGNTDNWNDGANDANWDTNGNWSSGTAPGTSDQAVFVTPIPNMAGTINVGNETIGSLSLNDGYALSGGSLNLTLGGLTCNSQTAAASIAGGTLTSSGGELDIEVAAANLNIGSAINGAGLDVVVGGSGGSGALVLSSTTSNFSGGIYINAGTVQISNDANLGANVSTNVVHLTGGTLQVANNVTLGSNRLISVEQPSTIFTNANTTFTIGADQLYSGYFTGTSPVPTPSPLVKDGAGTMVIGAPAGVTPPTGTGYTFTPYNGPVTVNAGTLQLQSTAALSSGGTSSSIGLNNGAQLNLRTDGPFSAPDANGNRDVTFGNTVTVNGASATIDIDRITNAGASGNIQLGALNLPVNTTLNITGNSSGASNTLEFTGTTTIGQGASNANVTINNSVSVRLGGPVTGNGGLTKTGSGTLALSGFAPNTYANTTNVLGGILALNDQAGNAVPGDLIMTGGTVVLMTNSQIAKSSNVTVNTGGQLMLNGNQDTVATLTTNSGSSLTTSGGTLSAAISTAGGTGITTLSGGVFTVNPGLVNGVVQGGTYNTLGLAVSAGINTVQAMGVMNVGTAGIVFSGTNPTITIAADSSSPGMMMLAGNVSYQPAGTGGLASITTNISIGPPQLPGTVDLMGTRTYMVSSGNTMDVSATVTDGSIVMGGGASGGGLLRLDNGSNNFAGGVQITNGIVEATSPGALGTGPLTFAPDSTVSNPVSQLNLRSDAATTTWTNSLTTDSNNSPITVNLGGITTGSPGTFTMSGLTLGTALNVGNAPTSGNFPSSTGGTLAFLGLVTLQTNAAINLSGSTSVSFLGGVTGPFSLTLNGSGSSTLTLGGSSSNTYTGSTTVQGGVLQLSTTGVAVAVPSSNLTVTNGTVLLTAPQQLNPNINVTLSSSSVLNLNGQTQTVASVTADSTSTIALGGGTIIFNPTGTLTYGGIITGSSAGTIQNNSSSTVHLSGNITGFNGGGNAISGTLSFDTPPGSLNGPPATATLVSGMWMVNSGATLAMPGVSITTNQTNVMLNGPAASFPAFTGSFTTNAAQGSFTATGGLVFSTAGGLTNNGTVTVGPNSTINVTGAVGNLNGGSTLTGGTWIVGGGATLNFLAGAAISTNQANVTLGGAGASFPAFAGFSTNGNQGSFTVSGGATFTTTGMVMNNGNVTVGASSSLSGSISGTGTTSVAAGGILTASAFTQNTLANNGSVSVAGNGTIASVSGNGTLTVGNGSTGATLNVAGLAQNGVTVNSGSVLTLSQGTTPMAAALNALTLNGTGTLDLKNNGFILDYTGASPLATIAAEIASGRNAGGTPWTGTGITSSIVAADPSQLTIVYGLASAILPSGGTFMGQTIPAGANAVLARVSFIGDANGDGQVNSQDIVQIVSRGHYNDGTTGNTPFDGDFNDDGTVNSKDIVAIVASGNYSSGQAFSAISSFSSQAAAALKSASHTTDAAFASPSKITGGAPDYVYDPATGDLTFNRNGFDPTRSIQALTVYSATRLFQVGAANGYTANQIANGNGADINSATEQFALNFNGFNSSIDLGDVLPLNLTQAFLEGDLSVDYAYPGGPTGPTGDGMPAGIVGGVPEPSSLMLAAGGVVGLAMRRRRRSKGQCD